MGIIKEFKEFALKGNVIDLAVGVIIGAAFNKIVTSLVEDLLNPLLGRVVGDLDFANLYLSLSAKVPQGLDLKAARALGPVLAWGSFVTVALNFVIIAFCIFLLVKGINRFRRQETAEPPAPPAPTRQEALLTEIRDAIRSR